MNTETLLKILQLDSIAHLLTWEERIKIHLYRNGRANASTPLSMTTKRLYEWIEFTKWQPPEMRYGQDRLLYFLTPALAEGEGEWQPIEELEKEMKTIKIL